MYNLKKSDITRCNERIILFLKTHNTKTFCFKMQCYVYFLVGHKYYKYKIDFGLYCSAPFNTYTGY